MVWEKKDGRQTMADAVDRLARTENGSALDADADVRIEREAPNPVLRAELAFHASRKRQRPACPAKGMMPGKPGRHTSTATWPVCEAASRQPARRAGFADRVRIGMLP